MAHYGILTNGRFSIREDHIFTLVEVRDVQIDLVQELVLEVELFTEELSVDLIVTEELTSCKVVEG